MKAIITLCIAHIRKRKIQNSLIAILILLSTLLLVTAITIIINTSNMFERAHKESNGAHQILTMGNAIHNPVAVHKWWAQQPGVTASELIPFRNLSGIKIKGTEIPHLYLFMMNTPRTPLIIDQLVFAEGEKKLYPEEGTIWIPTSMATTFGIDLGDMVEFHAGRNNFKLSVTAIVVDMAYGGPFTTNARIWMNDHDYNAKLYSMTGSDQYMLSLRYDDYSQHATYWTAFEQNLNGPYLELKMEYEEIASFYLIINKIIGFIMIILGVAMLFISLFIIGFSISDAILSNYKTIGVIKSVGLTSKGIIATYVMQYGLLAVIAIFPGLLASNILSRIIIESSLSFLKAGKQLTIIHNFSLNLLLGILIFTIILITAYFYANKARLVEPVQAIKYGMSELANSKMNRRLNNSNRILHFIELPIQLKIGLKNITKNMKASILTIILTSITSAILVFSFVILNSFVSIKKTSPAWGYDDSNIIVTVFNEASFSKERFEKQLNDDRRIKNYAWQDQFTGVLPNKTNQTLNININVIEGNYDDLGYVNIIGHNPSTKNEIAIGINVARTLDKSLGDVIDVYIEGQHHHLLITGIYQSIANMSNSARITADVIKVYRADYSASEISMINLMDETLSDQVVNDLSQKFKDSLSAVTQQTLLDSVFKEVIAVLIIPLSVMGILFMTVTCIIIFSISRINVRKESSTYGIYKALGLTSMNIRCSITFVVFILSTIGAILGIFFGIKLIPMALKNIILDYGLIELPLVVNWPLATAIACLSIVAACIGCWLSTNVITKTSPRVLLVD
ncbi:MULTISPECIES: FtsX-like permease family protein [unclassified Lysinibacillus]|uniref:ABC transporter permease n=1 Tax=unclassified Lysinibacillus TaxID=2636778 RepID=UPI003807BFFD